MDYRYNLFSIPNMVGHVARKKLIIYFWCIICTSNFWVEKSGKYTIKSCGGCDKDIPTTLTHVLKLVFSLQLLYRPNKMTHFVEDFTAPPPYFERTNSTIDQSRLQFVSLFVQFFICDSFLDKCPILRLFWLLQEVLHILCCFVFVLCLSVYYFLGIPCNFVCF